MEINCLFCGKKYTCMFDNTRITGSIIETKCPKCNKKLIKNLSSFIEAQVNEDPTLVIRKTIAMQKYKNLLLSVFSEN